MDTHGGRAALARALGAEAAATALLVWLGVQALLPAGGAAPPLASVALAFGGVVAGAAAAFGAHMNPAVTLAEALAGRLGAGRAAALALAQLAGAVAGYGALLAVTGAAAPGGATLPAAGVSAPAAAAIEAALTGLLALACLALGAGAPDAAAPLKVGLLVAGLVCAGGEWTGASLNPARSFAPALLHWRWTAHWVYWAGPLGGAAAAAALHRLLHPRGARPPPAPETLPLADKP